jgi:integrase
VVAIEVGDLSFEAAGPRLTIRKSKTDQDSRGAEIGITSAVVIAALQVWLATARITEGAVFRAIDRDGNVKAGMTDQSVALIIKKRAAAIGQKADDFSGHSLRRGFVTTAARAEVPAEKIMKVTRHSSEKTLRQYIESATVFDAVPASALGI